MLTNYSKYIIVVGGKFQMPVIMMQPFTHQTQDIH